MVKGFSLETFVILTISSFCVGQRPDFDICSRLLRCLSTSPSYLCPVMFSYYNCGFDPTPSGQCGKSEVTGNASNYPMPRVFGGVEAVDGEFPWMVQLRDKSNPFNSCSGSILETNVVITAAHCVIGLVNSPERIEVGHGSVTRTQLTYAAVIRIIVHPNYDSANSDNDIALVILKSDLSLSDNTRSICLPEPGRSYPDSSKCIISGWGVIDGYIVPAVLQKAAVPLVPRDVCKNAYVDFRFLIAERQICAGYFKEGGVDACKGDSGGPLFCPDGDQWVLYGIVSVGNQCAQPKFPGVYAFVPQHVNWIQSQLPK